MHHRHSVAVRVSLAVALVSTLALTACSPSQQETTPEPHASSTEDFPRSIPHALGTATVPERPSRVITLGAADTQIAAALGLTIVGSVKDPSSADGNWPGVAHPLPPEVTVLDSVEPNLEQIAALEPDIILATSAQPGYGQLYGELSRVAPVIAYPTALMQDSGDDLARIIATATGKEDQAEELIRTADAAVAEFVSENGGLAGSHIVFGQYAGGTSYLLASPEALSVRFLTRLGLTPPPSLQALYDSGDSSYAGSLGMVTPSGEQLGILDDADIALISAFGAGAEKEFLEIPVVAGLDIVSDGALHLIDQSLAAPLLQPNPATTRYLLDALRPLLAPLRHA